MFAFSILRVVIRRPLLWPEALRTLVAFTPRRWWQHAPFLPVPRRPYLRWRLQTAYGSPDAAPAASDLVHFLEWRKDQR
ncbi:MAG: hypothetical protein HKN80_05900 [Acidimicrobiia bacterium]|nr:hypothetical protein [Acidimicrobiia bacterium]